MTVQSTAVKQAVYVAGATDGTAKQAVHVAGATDGTAITLT